MPAHDKEAHRRPHAETVPTSPTCDDTPTLDVNAIVAFNIRAIRRARGLTQDQVADRLAQFTGNRLPQASISQMERAFADRKRRRLFNAHDLYLLSNVFEVPIVYFFLPPPVCLDQSLANTYEPVSSVLDSLFGTPTSLGPVDKRLVEIADHAREPHASGTERESDRVLAPHLHVSRLAEVDCNARLREIVSLLQHVLDRHGSQHRGGMADLTPD